MGKKVTHYIVTSPVNDWEPSHIHAESQEDAVRQFVDYAENPHGYSREFYDGYEIYVVPDSMITRWQAEIVEPPEPPPQVLKLTKDGKGT